MDKERKRSTIYGYNGWSNYGTWVVQAWLGSTEQSRHYWLEQARMHNDEARDHLVGDEDRCICNDIARSRFATQLKCEIAQVSPYKKGNLYGELLNVAFSNIDWLEIADRWISGVEDFEISKTGLVE